MFPPPSAGSAAPAQSGLSGGQATYRTCSAFAIFNCAHGLRLAVALRHYRGPPPSLMLAGRSRLVGRNTAPPHVPAFLRN
jgi:hypothetical protein